ncbi:hypothetical protein SEA_JEFE_41 [Microbacterium phage Jefe]|uniref:Uncharacterized protein n=1 Tax=Microbacterium phage Quhwah TaxID=2992929 RepID=A0A2Z4QAW7_9CAUD|nr:hypothetical protein HOT47_gp44 [Microbacterium phage Quhwah]AWY06753.1 hypothetical protein SEA_QUHWAH_44 [Microbacterium phage Quhwah]WBF79189.1 hypothetical protein SEA_JEFE_41 [Microbacterium phage Jefe]
MLERTEQTFTTLTEQIDNARFIATSDAAGVIDVQVQTIETYATLRLPARDLPGLIDFLVTVQADPAFQPLPEPNPDPEPTPEGDGAVVPEGGELTA